MLQITRRTEWDFSTFPLQYGLPHEIPFGGQGTPIRIYVKSKDRQFPNFSMYAVQMGICFRRHNMQHYMHFTFSSTYGSIQTKVYLRCDWKKRTVKQMLLFQLIFTYLNKLWVSEIANFYSFLKRCITLLQLYYVRNQSKINKGSQKLKYCNLR